MRVFDPCLYGIHAGRQKLAEILKSFQPDIVGNPLYNIDMVMRRNPFVHFRTLAPMVRLIREAHPEGIIGGGETAFSLYAQQIMKRIGEVDFGIYLEGEETIVELHENINTPGNVKGPFWRKGARSVSREGAAAGFQPAAHAQEG